LPPPPSPPRFHPSRTEPSCLSFVVTGELVRRRAMLACTGHGPVGVHRAGGRRARAGDAHAAGDGRGGAACVPRARQARRAQVRPAMQNMRIGGLARGDWKWSLNEEQIPNSRVVRVALGTCYHRVEGNRRASRNGRVSDLPPPEIPNVTIRNFVTAVCLACARCSEWRLIGNTCDGWLVVFPSLSRGCWCGGCCGGTVRRA
jgi:hypothetical protein